MTNLNPVPIEINANVFYGTNTSVCSLKVPMGSVSAYQEAPVWKNFMIEGIDVGIYDLRFTIYDLLVYPNPTSGELRFAVSGERYAVSGERCAVSGIEVFDVNGRKVSSHHLIISSSNHLINISHLPAGIYFVRVRTEQGVVTKKVVKM
jgi:hypothetical protein